MGKVLRASTAGRIGVGVLQASNWDCNDIRARITIGVASVYQLHEVHWICSIQVATVKHEALPLDWKDSARGRQQSALDHGIQPQDDQISIVVNTQRHRAMGNTRLK